MNGDGLWALAVANPGIAAWLSGADGTFLPVGGSTAADHPMDLGIGDFNGDGILDVASVGSKSASLSLLLNLGTRRLADPVSYPATRRPTAVAHRACLTQNGERGAAGGVGISNEAAPAKRCY